MPKGIRKDGSKLGFQKGHKIRIGKKNTEKTKIKMSKNHWDNSGKNHPQWKGGRVKHTTGYIQIHSPRHPFRDCYKYVFEHRLVVEKYIGHYLKSEESCHHLNEIKDDNRPENLMAFISESAHQRFHKDPNSVKPSEIIFDGRHISKHSLI